MDLCCLTGNTSDPQPSASELVEILAQLIREETDFNVMPLPNARIPIIKINRSESAFTQSRAERRYRLTDMQLVLVQLQHRTCRMRSHAISALRIG